VNLKTKQTLSVIFSVGGAIGTLATVLLARKAAMKEAEMRWYYTHQMTPDQGDLDLMKPIEQIKIIGPTYIPTAIAGILTIGSMIGSTAMSHKVQASLMSMAVIADQGWKRYKNQVKSTLGIESHENVLKNIAKGKIMSSNEYDSLIENDGTELYFDELVGYFRCKPEDLMYAYSKINEILNTVADPKTESNEKTTFSFFGAVTIGKFLEVANAKILDKHIDNDILKTWGWTSEYLEDVYKHNWIHAELSNDISNDNISYKVISWMEEPTLIDFERLYGTKDELSLDDMDIEEFDMSFYDTDTDE
jgi:hypothetical protein